MTRAEGKIPRSLAESQKVSNSCQKAQGYAAADLFHLGYAGSGQEGRPNSKILLGTRARMGGGREVGCRKRVQGRRDVQVFMIPLVSSFPL